VDDLWESEALPALRAVFDASRSGKDMQTAAVEALAEVSEPERSRTLWWLFEDGYLNGTPVPLGGDRPPAVHVTGIRPKGLRVIKVWPGESAAEEFLKVLAERIESEKDPVEKDKLVKVREAVTNLASSVFSSLIAHVLTRG
jgi:hypothetical protein